MISKNIAAILLTTALMTGAASAQTTTTTKADATNAAMHREGEWRGSKLVGVNVYNEANEKIGDINELILDKSGKVTNVILAVGGFLGMGEHYVAVNYDKLKWVNEPVRSTSASTASDSNSRTTGAATTTTRSANENWYPDHAVYDATKEQLKALPQFKY
jgi:sporulation protein YlmC with PRC-barrel domain